MSKTEGKTYPGWNAYSDATLGLRRRGGRH